MKIKLKLLVQAYLKHWIKLLFFFLLLIVQATYLYGQNPTIKFEYLSVNDGLSDPSVTDIYKDSEDFIWIGTKNGLNRYDGYSFTSFRANSRDKNALNKEYIQCISEDNQQNLIIGKWGGGLSVFDREEESFTHYLNDPDDKNSLSHNWIRVIFKDSKQRIWIGTQNGLNLYNPEEKTFKRYLTNIHNPENPLELMLTSIYEIDEDSKGNLWIATWSGLFIFHPNSGRLIHLDKTRNPSFFSTNRLQSIYIDKYDDVWIGTFKTGLIRLKNIIFKGKAIQAESITYTKISDSHGKITDLRINDIIGDDQGNIWVATEVGLNYYDFTNDSFQHYYHDPESDNSLSNNYITKLFFDDQKILWVGTLDNGLNKYDKGNRKFFISFPEINNSQNTDIKNVKSVYQDSKNRYWIGSDFGLFLYSPDFELLNIFRHDPKDKKTLDIGGITGICEDIYDQIWICTWGGGLHQLNQSNWEFSRIPRQGNDPFESRMYNDPFDIHNLGDADVRCMQPDNYGRIWVGTTLGFIDCYDINKKTFVHHFIYDKDSLRGVPVTSMELSRNGILWAGGLENGGLIKLDPKTMHIKRYFASEKKNSLLSNDVYSLCIDQHDNVWIGTDMGISMLNTSTDSFVNFSEKINLVNQTVYNIEIDHKENLWISTATKMIQYNIEQNSIIEYFVQDGIKKKVIAGITDNKGNIIVGGINGVNMIDEDQFTKNNAIPRIVFTDFRLFNEKIDFKNDSSVLKNHINCVDEIRLNYKQGFFSIGFAALNYSQTAKNRYKYRLEGIDYDWVDAGNSRYASYTNIAPGTYTFKVMGSNNDDIWNPDGRVLSIIIDPPWYKTWWSLTLLLMLLISIIFIIIKISLGRERLKSEIVLEKMNARRNKELLNKEREVDQLKQQFFTNISHEFRSPLTLILGPVGELLKKNSLETKDAQNLTIVHKNAGRLLRLVNQVMDFSKIDLGFMKFVVTEDNIALQIVTIVETFNNHAERKSIRYSYTTSHNRVVGYFDPDKIEKILYNLISNAFKFTPDNGIIEISVRYYKNGTLLSFDDIFADSIEIKVSDSGIGISEEDQEFIFKRFYQANKSKNGTGIGLSLAHSLAKIHGGDINVSSKEGCGATFTLELPLVLEKMDNFVLMEHLRIPPEIIEITPQGNRINKPIKERKREDEVIQKDHAKRIVLVVEDNLEIQEYIQSILIDFYHLEFADDGEKGFMKAVSIIPDLIISDLMMPVMDGYMLCDEIKARQETSHIPVILLTAKVNPDAKLIGLAHGAIDYMIKPFEPQELKLKVDNIIDTQYKLRDKISVHGNFSFKVTSHNSIDEKFLKDVFRIIEENLSDSEFDHHVLSKEIGMSRAQLYRKMKALTSKSVHEIIRDFRLEKSLEFLRDKGKNVSEVMYEVGFKNSSYFTKCFKEQYDISPSEYKKSII